MAHVEVWRNPRDDLWYARMKTENNGIVWTTEGHENQVDCAETALKYAPEGTVMHLKESQ